MEATIKRRPASRDSWARWFFFVYVDGKVLRSGSMHGDHPICSFSLGEARAVAASEFGISGREITRVRYAWTGRVVSLQEAA